MGAMNDCFVLVLVQRLRRGMLKRQTIFLVSTLVLVLLDQLERQLHVGQGRLPFLSEKQAIALAMEAGHERQFFCQSTFSKKHRAREEKTSGPGGCLFLPSG